MSTERDKEVDKVLSSASKLASYSMMLQDGLKENERKRMKTNDITKSIEYVSPNNYQANVNVLCLKKVIAASIKDKKSTTEIMKFLQDNFPLKNLQHIKRIKFNGKSKQLDIILVVSDIHVEAFLKLNSSLNNKTIVHEIFTKISHLIEKLYICEIPTFNSITKDQHKLAMNYWPVSFHEDKGVTKLLTGACFQPDDIQVIYSHMKTAILAAELSARHGGLSIGAVVVHSTRNTVLSISFDLRHVKNDYFGTKKSQVHPLQHAAMVAIDLVARSHGGGFYKYDEFLKHGDFKIANTHDKADYICTDCDLYITHEPCVMCAMALLHSRIKRVFYGVGNSMNGGLGGAYKLHCMPKLNHSFHVFKNVLYNECIKL